MPTIKQRITALEGGRKNSDEDVMALDRLLWQVDKDPSLPEEPPPLDENSSRLTIDELIEVLEKEKANAKH